MDTQSISKEIKANITEQGLLISKEWLDGVEKVEVRKKDTVITIIPVEKDDPIFKLGKTPVTAGITDGSMKHDKYIYSQS